MTRDGSSTGPRGPVELDGDVAWLYGDAGAESGAVVVDGATRPFVMAIRGPVSCTVMVSDVLAWAARRRPDLMWKALEHAEASARHLPKKEPTQPTLPGIVGECAEPNLTGAE